jgi:alpha-glucosidase
MEESMHCCALPAILADVSEIPRRSSSLLAQGMSGGGWAWLDASSRWSSAAITRSSPTMAALARRRAIELAAFGPVFEFEAPEVNVPGSDDELRFLARMSLIFSLLRPYHEAVAVEYRSSPLPPIRYTLVHYEDGGRARSLHSQYFYGRDLLIAVSGNRGEFVSLELPDDEWIHLWSSRRFRGGPVSIEAPPGQPAVFCRASSVFGPLFDSIRRETRRK